MDNRQRSSASCRRSRVVYGMAAVIVWTVGCAIAVFTLIDAVEFSDVRSALRNACAGITVCCLFAMMGWRLIEARKTDE
jgi:hypothetical protein